MKLFWVGILSLFVLTSCKVNFIPLTGTFTTHDDLVVNNEFGNAEWELPSGNTYDVQIMQMVNHPFSNQQVWTLSIEGISIQVTTNLRDHLRKKIFILKAEEIGQNFDLKVYNNERAKIINGSTFSRFDKCYRRLTITDEVELEFIVPGTNTVLATAVLDRTYRYDKETIGLCI